MITNEVSHVIFKYENITNRIVDPIFQYHIDIAHIFTLGIILEKKRHNLGTKHDLYSLKQIYSFGIFVMLRNK